MANQMVVLDNTSADPRNWKVDYTVDNPGAAIATLETAGTLVDRNIQIVVNTPAGGATVSGGTLSVTNNYSATPTVNLTLEGQTTTGITLQSSAPAAGYYVEISGKTSALFGTTTVNRAATSLELTSGYVSGQTFSSVLTSTSASPTVSISSATSIGYLKLPTATFAASGSSIYSSAAGWVAANQPINSITVGTLSAMTTAVSNAQVSLKGNGIAAGNSASPYYISLNTTAGSVTPRVEVTSDGYVTEIQNTNGTPVSVDITGKDSKYYLPTNTISASVSDLTSGSVTITTALTGITTTSTNTGYKITIGSTVSTGSVKGQASAGATTGVVAANAFAVSNATTITPSVTGTTSFYLPASTLSLSGGGLTPNAGSATLYNGGYYNGTNYAVNDTIDLGTTATTGYYQLVVEGKGTVSRAAITGSITTGYTTANSTSIATTSISSTTSTAYYYIKKSTLSAASVTPSTTTATVTVTSGYYKDDRTITIAAMTTVTPTTSYTNSGLSTYFTAGTSSDYNVAITPRYSNSAGYVTAHTNTNNGGIEYWKITTAKLSQGSTTTSGTSATRGIASIATSGWIEATTISAAKFASSATSGISYIDISNTTEAPALVAGDYLYINKGYTDNLKISLAKLLPGEATITGSGASYASNQMLNGVTAYDTEGHLITGNILTRDSGNVSETRTATSGYVTVTSGYYASNVTKALTSGAYSADSSTSTNSEVTPSVSITSASTYGFATSTAGMGTYLTINPGATATDWSVTPRAKITTSGYLPTGNTTGTAVSGSPSIKDGTNYYVPVASYTFSCGTTTASIASNTITVTGMNTTTTNTGYKIEATAAGTYDFGAVTYTNTAGVTAAHGTAQSVKARSSGSMTSKSATTAYIAAAAIASTGSINNTTVTTKLPNIIVHTFNIRYIVFLLIIISFIYFIFIMIQIFYNKIIQRE